MLSTFQPDNPTPWLEPNERKVDVAVALRAYQHIVNRSARCKDAYVMDELRARESFDGYTIILSDEHVTLRIFFHNRFAIEPAQGRVVERFLTRLREVAEAPDTAAA